MGFLKSTGQKFCCLPSPLYGATSSVHLCEKPPTTSGAGKNCSVPATIQPTPLPFLGHTSLCKPWRITISDDTIATAYDLRGSNGTSLGPQGTGFGAERAHVNWDPRSHPLFTLDPQPPCCLRKNTVLSLPQRSSALPFFVCPRAGVIGINLASGIKSQSSCDQYSSQHSQMR